MEERINKSNHYIKVSKECTIEKLYEIISNLDFSIEIDDEERISLLNNYNINELKDTLLTEKYIECTIGSIIDNIIKEKLLDTIESIKNIKLPLTVNFVNTHTNGIIEENIKDINRPIDKLIGSLITKELKLDLNL